MNWLTRILPKVKESNRKGQTPEGLWIKCDECGESLFHREVDRNLHVCPRCRHHRGITAQQRIDFTLDPEGREELFGEWQSSDPLRFRDSKRYRDRLKDYQKQTGHLDAILVYKGTIKGIPVVVGAFDFGFMGGSMGSVVGAKIAHGALAAVEARCGYVVFPTSGGARMQEGILSLMQMAKTAAALTRMEEARLPFIPVLTNPTTGGVTASFAMLGDVTLAEPNALIGFAGPRVIEQTIREQLPEGFQRSEYLLEHGQVDHICQREEIRDTLADLLSRLTGTRLPLETVPPPRAAAPPPVEEAEPNSE